MKAVIQDFASLSDSRELYETRPFPVGVYTIYLLLTLILAALVWAGFSEIDVVVKASGVVRPYKNVNTIANTVASRVKDVYYSNGDYVKKGDTIIKLDIEGLAIEESGLIIQLESLQEEIKLLERLKTSVQTGKNLFDAQASPLEENYHFLYLKFQMDLANSQEITKMATSKRAATGAELEGTKAFLSSIDKESDAFPINLSSTESYQEYMSYAIQMSDLELARNTYKQDFENKTTLYTSGSVSKVALDEAKLLYDQAENRVNKYISDTKLSLKTKLERYTESIQSLEGDLNAQANFNNQTLININNQIQGKQKELTLLNTRLESLNLSMTDTELKAPINGYINFNGEYTQGNYITPGTEVATIIPENGESFKIQIAVPNKDISNVDVGDRVKYRFDALPYKEYGVLEGTITNISVDAKFNEAKGTSYYLVESTVDNKPLKSYKGTEANIKVGMTLEAQVLSESKSLLKYLLEKVDLWD